MSYKPTQWKNRVYDEQGNILEDGTGLWAEYLNNMEEGIVNAHIYLDSRGQPDGIATLDENGVVNTSQLPANLKEMEVVHSLDEMNNIDPKFKGLRVMVIVDDKWKEFVYDGELFIEVGSSEHLSITLDWDNIKDKPVSFTPKEHLHSESDIKDLDKYSKAEIDVMMADFLTQGADILQTRNNVIGWEKNALFNAPEKFQITEENAKADSLVKLFDGRLDPTSIRGISEEKPYILTISNIALGHTQSSGQIGWISRYRYPIHFKIEIYDSFQGANQWETIAEETNYNKPYYYSPKIHANVSKIRFTIYEVVNMVDAYAQIGQFIFIHPEGCRMYDDLLVSHDELSTVTSQQQHTQQEVEALKKTDHSHTNKNVLDKIEDLGNHDKIDLDRIYSHTHNYADIRHLPHIPSKLSELKDDLNVVSSDTQRQIFISEEPPTRGKEGDIWIRI